MYTSLYVYRDKLKLARERSTSANKQVHVMMGMSLVFIGGVGLVVFLDQVKWGPSNGPFIVVCKSPKSSFVGPV